MKKFLLLIVSALYSQGCPPIDTCAPTNCAFLPSASPCTFWNFSLDFLYWEATERGLEYAVQNSIHQPDFEFKPAFRVGLQTYLPYDDWDLEFTYTQYETHTKNHTTGNIQSVWTSVAALWQQAEAKWKLNTYFFDLQLKNRLFLSNAISIEPAFGLKLALIQQHFDVLYGNLISSQIEMKNDSFNLGMAAALNSRWRISDHFDILADLSGALLSSHFDVRQNETGATSLRKENEYWAMRPQVTAIFGLGWRDAMCRNDRVVSYGLQASYEAQVWWKQNMLYRFIDQTNAAMIAPTQGDLFFHGLTLEGYLEF